MKPKTIVLEEKDFAKEALNCGTTGTVLDMIAFAATGSDYEEACSESETDSKYEAVKWVLDRDYEADYIKWLNRKHEKDETDTQGLQFGAWMALEKPREFEKGLKEFAEKAKEAVMADIFSCSEGEYVTKELAEEVNRAIDETGDQIWREWLHGDGRSWEGILDKISKWLFEEKGLVSYENGKDEVTLKLPEGYAQELKDYGNVAKGTKKEIKGYLVDKIETLAKFKRDSERKKIEERRLEAKRIREYQEKIEAEKKEARIKKLKKMTR